MEKDFTAQVHSRLISLIIKALTEEYCKKLPEDRTIKQAYRVKEFKGYKQYMEFRLSFMRPILEGVIGQNIDFLKSMEMAHDIGFQLYDLIKADGIIIYEKQLYVERVQYMIFEAILDLAISGIKWRYHLLGQTHKNYLKFLKQLNIDPDL